MANELESTETTKSSSKKGKGAKKTSGGSKMYPLKQDLRLGSNKDGSPKKEYKKGDKVRLSDKKAKLYKSLNLI